jgi:hypothetical protein
MMNEQVMSPQYDQDDMMDIKDTNMLSSPDDKHKMTKAEDKEDG